MSQLHFSLDVSDNVEWLYTSPMNA